MEGKGDAESHADRKKDSQTGKWANGKRNNETELSNSLMDQQKDRQTDRQAGEEKRLRETGRWTQTDRNTNRHGGRG